MHFTVVCYASMDTPYGLGVLLPRRAAAVSARAPQYPYHRLPQTHYWVERCTRIYTRTWGHSALCGAAVLTHILGGLIAALNTFWLVLSSLLEYTEVYHRCYCKGDQLGLGGNGWLVLFKTDAELARFATTPWARDVAMSIIVCFITHFFLLVG